MKVGESTISEMLRGGGDARGWLVKRYLTAEEEHKLRAILTRKEEIPYYPMMKLIHLSELLYIEKINLPDMFFRSFKGSEEFNTEEILESINSSEAKEDNILAHVKMLNGRRIVNFFKKFKHKETQKENSQRLGRRENKVCLNAQEMARALTKDLIEGCLELSEQR